MSDSPLPQNGVSSPCSAPAPDPQAAAQVWCRNMQALRNALIQDDLAAARGAFAALQVLSPLAPQALEMSPAVVNTGARAFVALYRALEAGNMNDARSAYLRLLASLRCPPPRRPRIQRPLEGTAGLSRSTGPKAAPPGARGHYGQQHRCDWTFRLS